MKPNLSFSYKYLGAFFKLPSECKSGDVATLMTLYRGGKTVYRNFICERNGLWQLLDNIEGESMNGEINFNELRKVDEDLLNGDKRSFSSKELMDLGEELTRGFKEGLNLNKEK